MKGGIDSGWCFSYWRLSYRRKFIRTVWIAAIGLPLMLVMQIFISTPAIWVIKGVPVPFPPDGAEMGWYIFGLAVALSLGQAGYNCYHWRQEEILSAEQGDDVR